jgi:glycosyltransferase involved in cell wall biosynthesis
MKILVLPPSDYLGHPNPCRLHHIFEQFPEFGDDVFVTRFSIQNKIKRKSNVTVLSIGDTHFESLALYYGFNSFIFKKALLKIIKEYEIDIVISANLFPPYLISKVASKNYLSIVDLVDHYPTVAAENVPILVPKRIVNSIFSSMMRSIIANSDVSIGCSYKLAEYAKSVGAKEVYRIPNGVEEYFFNDYKFEAQKMKQKLGINDSDLSICFVGNIEYWLSMGQFLEALYKIKKKIPKRLKFCIVGGKLTTNYLGQIESQVKKFNLQENVIQTGFVPHSDVPKYIALADICVSPKNPRDPVSYYSSPVKVWEYLAQGKPVISTPVPEIIQSASDCVSIANNSQEYCNHIMSFIEDPSLYQEKAHRGREMIKNFTWQKVARSYRDLLKQVLERKSGYVS